MGDDAGQSRRTFPQHPADFAAGRVVCVQDAAGAVRALDGQRGRAVRIAIEPGAPRHQFPDVLRTVFDEDLNGPFVAEPIPRRHRVGGVELGGIIGAHRGSDPALGVAGVALARLRFRQDQNVAGTRELGGGTERSDAAADDDEIRAKLHA